MTNHATVRRLAARAGVGAALLVMVGCAGLVCEDPSRYSGSASAEPLRVPDRLNPPDESRAMWVPPPMAQEPEAIPRRNVCLESPPDFFSDRTAHQLAGRDSDGETVEVEVEAPAPGDLGS